MKPGWLTKRLAKRVLLGGIALLVVIQLVPYGHSHSNPPVTRAAGWPVGPGEEIARRSCYDCHSNLTKWRWYSNAAPMSWLIQRDVEGGRDSLNFSEWNRGQADLGDVVEQVSGGGMPPLQYTIVHPSASLSSTDQGQLVAALKGLYSADPPPPGGTG
jgi:hypothetical protein